MRSQAIRTTHPTVVTINGGVDCRDSDWNVVEIDEVLVEAEVARLQAEYDAQAYARNRQTEYPSINDLIVALWENVVEERASAVVSLEAKRQAVKTKYPKP